jgi:hypothetical protein
MWGMKQMPAALAPKNKNMSLGLIKLPLRQITALLAGEKCSHTCLYATKRKIMRKRTEPFTAKKDGYVGHGTNADCPRPEYHIHHIHKKYQGDCLASLAMTPGISGLAINPFHRKQKVAIKVITHSPRKSTGTF